MPDETLTQIARRIGAPPDGQSKRHDLYDRYEPYFAPFADRTVKMLELGVHVGESLKIFSAYFRNGIVVGVDVRNPGVDLSGFPNAVFEIGDQRNAEQLRALSLTHAPNGWDIILDDATHYGSWSLLSYEALFPHLKQGGLYIVEDWHTGYWDDWPDGSRYQRMGVDVPDGHIPRRVPSHDSGMVGFIKFLVDDVADRPASERSSFLSNPRRFESMYLCDDCAILTKRAG